MFENMEELLPVTARLAEQYTSYESTSVTYERAQQLMEAVLYCIHEAEQSGNGIVTAEQKTAQYLYETGVSCVKRRTKEALELYNEISAEFNHYENHCLYDTFVEGLPEFFKWYDVKFCPQDTIITLDYPVLKDISGYTGIDKIYEFIRCIQMEQGFLSIFPEDFVLQVLFRYDKEYRELIDNICEIVLSWVAVYILAGKPLSEENLDGADHQIIQEIFETNKMEDICGQLGLKVSAMVEKYRPNSRGLTQYLLGSIRGIAVRLKHGVRAGNPFGIR
ncbi:MAG: hypothetical protein HFH59_08360 [Lachnospiraceae bacterium]|jgi:hypothetical protein|nr:hypothetical protein [Lachnospiraceae bacterium]MCI9100603.1 hypothetical protein [Lachnospiraceae bacterium]MCI9357541.1 hypothetical protein [Lachnospiraceae bacterium]